MVLEAGLGIPCLTRHYCLLFLLPDQKRGSRDVRCGRLKTGVKVFQYFNNQHRYGSSRSALTHLIIRRMPPPALSKRYFIRLETRSGIDSSMWLSPNLVQSLHHNRNIIKISSIEEIINIQFFFLGAGGTFWQHLYLCSKR